MYSKVLQKILAEANITQREIADKCKELGTPISREQINKILNGKAPAPEESISRNIAKICNVDDTELVLEGYLEKAPKEFIDFLNNLQNMLLQIGLAFYDEKISEKEKEELIKFYEKETSAEILKGLLENNDTIEICSNYLKFVNKNDESNIVFNDFNYIEMKDNSMENKIPKGSKLRITIPNRYNNGDIALIETNKEKLVRIIVFMGKDIFVYPLNSKYKSQILKYGEYKILAKIRSIEIEA